jgi:Cu+-exporting ATPase
MADTRFSLHIDGMHCGGCVRRVQKALGDIPGVTVDRVDVGAATGTFDADDTDVGELVGAIGKLGFLAQPTTTTTPTTTPSTAG